MCEPPSSLRYSLSTGLSSGQEGSVQTEGVQGSVAQPCLTLCNPMDCSPPGSLFHRIFQARILDWVAISYSSGHLPDQWGRTHVSCIGRRIFYYGTMEAPPVILVTSRVCVCVCVCVCVSGSVVSDSLRPHGLYPARLLCPRDFQARILKWVAIPFSRISRDLPNPGIKPKFLPLQVDSLPSGPH